MNEKEIRLDQTKKVFDTLADLICKEETCTYRYLIYDLLGFDGYYADLISGMAITNTLVEYESLKERTKEYEHKQYITDFITENGIICQKNKEIEMLNKENNILKHRLNDIVFDEANDDVELAARYLRKIGYVDFDEEKMVYINKHNNEPFVQEEEREKDYYIPDEELDEYTKQLENQLQQKENIIKELNDKIEDDKMIIEGNWGCIDNLKKDYILHKSIIKEIKEYNEKIIKEGWYGGFEKENAKHNLEILDKERESE